MERQGKTAWDQTSGAILRCGTLAFWRGAAADGNSGQTLLIFTFVANEGYWGHGLGTELLTQIEELGREHKATEAEWSASTEGLRVFAARCGYHGLSGASSICGTSLSSPFCCERRDRPPPDWGALGFSFQCQQLFRSARAG